MATDQPENIRLAPPTPPGPPPEQMKEFEFLIGNWDVEIENYLPDGTIEFKEIARWFAEYRNGGRMVFDEFTRISPDGEDASCAVTLRTFCPETDQWESTFLFSLQQTVPHSFKGGFVNGEGWFDTTISPSPGQTFLARIGFINIEDDHFDWRLENSLDGGKTWIHRQSSSVTRVP